MMKEEFRKSTGFLESANHAIFGIMLSFKNERNFRIHFLSAILVLLLALRVGVSRMELVLLLVAITFVFMAEMINTTIEILTNTFVDQKNPAAKHAKDVAAGSVLIAAIGAAFVGYLVFFDKIRANTPFLFHQIRSIPVHVSVVSLLLVILLIVILKTLSPHGSPLRGGMPSGHAALAFATATIILWFAKDVLVASATYFLAAMVAQSRIEARMHTWWEVVSGALVGVFVTLLMLRVFMA